MARKITLSTFLFVLLSIHLSAQTTLVLQPGKVDGKDAHLDSYVPNTLCGDVAELNCIAWTVGGTPMKQRGIVEFNLSTIPTNATVQSATLSLFFNPNAINGSGQSTLSGSNSAILQKVTAPWNEGTITWNTQPGTTTLHEVHLPLSTSSTQSYVLQVDSMVQDMVAHPSTNFGFMLKLDLEDYYRSLVFASSDHPNETLHPKLVVTYSVPTAVAHVQAQPMYMNAFPNPAKGKLTIRLNAVQNNDCLITLSDVTGKVILEKHIKMVSGTTTHELELTGIAAGTYVLRASADSYAATEQITVLQ